MGEHAQAGRQGSLFQPDLETLVPPPPARQAQIPPFSLPGSVCDSFSGTYPLSLQGPLSHLLLQEALPRHPCLPLHSPNPWLF